MVKGAFLAGLHRGPLTESCQFLVIEVRNRLGWEVYKSGISKWRLKAYLLASRGGGCLALGSCASGSPPTSLMPPPTCPPSSWVVERYFSGRAQLVGFRYQSQSGCPEFRGAHGGTATQLGCPGTLRTAAPAAGVPWALEKPYWVSPSHHAEDGIGSVAWQPRQVIFGQSYLSLPRSRSSYNWDINLGCLLGFPKPPPSLPWMVSPHSLGHPSILGHRENITRRCIRLGFLNSHQGTK